MNHITKDVKDIDFSALMKRLLGLLTEKEQNIIERRFSLGNKKKETLDKIGKSYSITRERVRQIEAVAIKKLARISMDPSMRLIHDLAHVILSENGRVMHEDQLISHMLQRMSDDTNIDVNSMKLAMRVSDKLVKQSQNQFFHPFWRTKDMDMPSIRQTIKDTIKILDKQQDEVLDVEDVVDALRKKGRTVDAKFVGSLLYIDKRFLHTEDGWGLASCRFINPRSIKDKVMISLKEKQKPMHFREIIDAVLHHFKGGKSVTPQAIHNELIRHDEFVLVGRGMYGLKDWGLVSGTVCDVIRTVLQEAGEPMKRQDIIEKVLEKRDIRIGTISLNLQKYEFFRRVGRAVYTYDASLDNRKKKKRGRKKAV